MNRLQQIFLPPFSFILFQYFLLHPKNKEITISGSDCSVNQRSLVLIGATALKRYKENTLLLREGDGIFFHFLLKLCI
jgi:hypothetical protein